MKERDACDVKRSRKEKRLARIVTAILWVPLVLVMVVAATLDEPVREWQITKGEHPWRAVAEACSDWGDWLPLAGGVVALALVARFLKARRVVMICFLMLSASIVAGVVVNPLRVITGRARPSKKVEPGWYFIRHEDRWLAGKHAYSSFPSAHTTVAVALASPLFVAGWRAGLCGAIIAAAIGWSRIYLGAHHPSDVFAGACLGAFIGWQIVRSRAIRWWMWRAASAACGLRSRWPHQEPKRWAGVNMQPRSPGDRPDH